MEQLTRQGSGYNYILEAEIDADDNIIVAVPSFGKGHECISDIGWQSNGDVTIYGTLSSDPENTEMWQEIEAGEEINKTVSALKIVNNGAACSVVVRIIMC